VPSEACGRGRVSGTLLSLAWCRRGELVWPVMHSLLVGRLTRVGLGLGLALLVAGCGGRERPVDVATREGRFLMTIGADPQTLDPHVATGFTEFQVFLALFEGLTALDPVTAEPVPGVAESWEVSSDGRVYTFRLRPAARWSNGDPVTAHDFVYSSRRILSPTLGSEYAYFHHYVKNARAYHAGAADEFDGVGVRALDDHTLEIELEQATPYFPALLVHQAWLPVHRASVEAAGRFDDRTSPWARAGRLVGNGPFVLREWRHNERLVTVRNPFYHAADEVALNAVHFLPMESAETGDRAFRSGQVHVTDSLPIARIPVYREQGRPEFRSEPFLGTAFATFNTRSAPFDDERMRRAFSLAIDRTAIVERVLRGGQRPASSFTPPGTAGYVPPAAPLHDPEAARALLAEAGYAGGARLPRVEVLYATSDNGRLLAEALQEMWRRELGVEVVLRNVEWKVFLDALTSRQYQFAFMSWVGDYIDPNTFLSMMRGDSGNNRTDWVHAGYDALLDRAGAEAVPAERHALLREAEAILLAEVPIAQLWHLARNYLLDTRVRGWHGNLLDLHPYRHLSFARE
jgi:oligopeptide transport system substrate-binding protein